VSVPHEITVAVAVFFLAGSVTILAMVALAIICQVREWRREDGRKP